MKRELYEGDKWKNELEAIALPMLASCDMVLAEAPADFINELGGATHA